MGEAMTPGADHGGDDDDEGEGREEAIKTLVNALVRA